MSSEKILLEPTASLAMSLSAAMYKNSPVKKYFSKLDLNSGKKLLELYTEICPWYNEVILNRKFYIKRLMEQFAYGAKNNKHVQIIIPAAGKAPLSLELLSEKRLGIAHIFELDICGMREKEKLVRHLYPATSSKISFLTADISQPGWHNSVVKHAKYDPALPVITLFEGISYYLGKKSFKQSLKSLKTPNMTNTVIIEYKVPDKKVCIQRRHIPYQISSSMNKICSVENYSTYSCKDFENIAKSLHGKFLSCADMCEMEKLRTGKNTFFKNSRDGWVECACLKI